MSNFYVDGQSPPEPHDPRAEEIYFNFEDHTRFCKESLIVETEGRALVPMILSPGQVRLHQAIESQRQAGKPVRIVYRKSRRIQATTGTAAETWRRIQ